MSRTGEGSATMQQPAPPISTPVRVMTKSWGFLTFAAGFVASAFLFGGTLTRATFLPENDAKVRWDYCQVYRATGLIGQTTECSITSGSENETESFLKSIKVELSNIRMQDALIYLGKNGWELVTFNEGRTDNGFYQRVFMKKAK